MWDAVTCDVALPCATQNEINATQAQRLVDTGCYAVCEGANMPTDAAATEVFLQNHILFLPGKASTAGGVATSALEMGQNSIRSSWTFDEVDAKLQGIMVNIYHNMKEACEKYNATDNFVVGANIAGFMKVADAMMAQGVVCSNKSHINTKQSATAGCFFLLTKEQTCGMLYTYHWYVRRSYEQE